MKIFRLCGRARGIGYGSTIFLHFSARRPLEDFFLYACASRIGLYLSSSFCLSFFSAYLYFLAFESHPSIFGGALFFPPRWRIFPYPHFLDLPPRSEAGTLVGGGRGWFPSRT